MSLNKITRFVLVVLIVTSCMSKNVNRSTVDSYNSANSIKTFEGKFDSNELLEFRKRLNTELNIELPPDKTVLINFYQNGTYCSDNGVEKKYISSMIDNMIQASNDISSDNNAVDFFLYHDNVRYRELFEAREDYQLDSGFFYEQVFMEHLNCQAFFILKPDGDFIKHYGGDYYSIVKSVLEN